MWQTGRSNSVLLHPSSEGGLGGLTASRGPASGSSFTPYNAVSRDYDTVRAAPGDRDLTDQTIAAARRFGLSVKESIGAGVCCGTGTYELLMSRHLENANDRLGRMDLVDASAGMLEQARSKLAGLDVSLTERDIVANGLPWENDTFHWLTSVQASHHWDKVPNQEFEAVGGIFKEVRRVLKAEGTFLFIYSSQEQQRQGHWFMNVLRDDDPASDPCEMYARKFPTEEVVRGHLKEAGLELIKEIILPGPYIRPEIYFNDAAAFFEPSVRAANSFYALLEQSPRLEHLYNERLRAMIADGSIREHREKAAQAANTIGQAYLVVARAM